MGEKLKIDGGLDGSADLSLFASDWWRDDDARLLPGEESRRTVYQIEVRTAASIPATRVEACSGGFLILVWLVKW